MKKIERADDGRLIFTVRIVPRASRSEIVGWTHEGALKVRVTAPPVDQKANQALIKLLSKALGVAKGDVAIVAGRESRNKRLDLPDSCENRLLSISDI